MNKQKMIIILITILIITGCNPITPEETTEQKTLEIGLKSGIFGFQPTIKNYETSTMSVNFNIFNSLVEFDANYQIQAALATSWSNPDKNTWRFYLRKNVTFHNGDLFTAEDVKYTFDYILNDKENALRELLSTIESINIVDEYTIDIITKKPNPIMLNKIVDIYIIPKNYEQIPTTEWPIGTGAYTLKEYIKDDHITFERYDEYWKGKVPIQTVTIQIIAEDNERINALNTGKIDFAEFIPIDAEIKNKEQVKTVLFPGSRIIYLSFDFRETESHGFTDKNPTADIHVRKAIYYAINEDEIIKKVMKGNAKPASQFLSPNIFGYNQNIKRTPHNIIEAQKLMNEAGYPKGFTITLDCPNNRYVNDEAICKEIAEQLKIININVTVNAQPKAEFFPKILARNTSFYMLGWATDTADGGEIYDYLLNTVNEEEGTGTYNLGYYSNKEVDRIGKESAQTIDSKTRLNILQEGFTIAMNDIAWIPLHMQSLVYGISTEINWEPRADIKVKFEDVSFK